VACFWVTPFGKNLSAAAVRHHLVSTLVEYHLRSISWRWPHDTMHDIVEGLEVRG
jgi:hypothetical protein